MRDCPAGGARAGPTGSACNADDGADARRCRVGDGYLPARRRRARCHGAGTAAVRQVRPVHVHARHRHPVCGRGLRVRRAGRAWKVSLGRRDAGIRARGRRRIRHARMDNRAVVVERRGGHVGRFVLWLHPVGRGRQRPSCAEGDRAAGDIGQPRSLAPGWRRSAVRRPVSGRGVDRWPDAHLADRLVTAATQ